MWKKPLWASLLLVSCTKKSYSAAVYALLWTSSGAWRPGLLGQDTAYVNQVERQSSSYQDSLGLVYALDRDSLWGWIEYYVDEKTRVRTVALSYESGTFQRLASLYQELRQYLYQRYGSSEGVIGAEVWRRSDSLQVRLTLSPERQYVQLSFSLPP